MKNSRRVTTGKDPKNNHTLDVIYGYDESTVETTPPIRALIGTMFQDMPKTGYYIIINDDDYVLQIEEGISKRKLLDIARQYHAVLDVDNI